MCVPPAIIFEKIIANGRLNIYQFKQESPQRIVAMLILLCFSVIFFYAVLSLTSSAGCAFFSNTPQIAIIIEPKITFFIKITSFTTADLPTSLQTGIYLISFSFLQPA
jgi:hypothetical protein